MNKGPFKYDKGTGEIEDVNGWTVAKVIYEPDGDKEFTDTTAPTKEADEIGKLLASSWEMRKLLKDVIYQYEITQRISIATMKKMKTLLDKTRGFE